MNVSMQASGGRHLAPVAAPYVWRALVWAEFGLAGWKLLYVFDDVSQGDCEEVASELIDETAWETGVTNMHYIVGEADV